MPETLILPPEAVHSEDNNPEADSEALPLLPSVPEGYVRLYRGDVVDDNGQPIQGMKVESKSEGAGRWFTDNPNSAENYSMGRNQQINGSGRPRLRYIDLPAAEVELYRASNLSAAEMLNVAHSSSGAREEFILPLEKIAQSREYHLEESEEVYDEETIKLLREVFSDENVGYLIELGIKIDVNQDDLQILLEDMLQYVNSGHLRSKEPKQLKEKIYRALVGVQGAHKKRVLGSAPATERNQVDNSPSAKSARSATDLGEL